MDEDDLPDLVISKPDFLENSPDYQTYIKTPEIIPDTQEVAPPPKMNVKKPISAVKPEVLKHSKAIPDDQEDDEKTDIFPELNVKIEPEEPNVENTVPDNHEESSEEEPDLLFNRILEFIPGDKEDDQKTNTLNVKIEPENPTVENAVRDDEDGPTEEKLPELNLTFEPKILIPRKDVSYSPPSNKTPECFHNDHEDQKTDDETDALPEFNIKIAAEHPTAIARPKIVKTAKIIPDSGDAPIVLPELNVTTESMQPEIQPKYMRYSPPESFSENDDEDQKTYEAHCLNLAKANWPSLFGLNEIEPEEPTTLHAVC